MYSGALCPLGILTIPLRCACILSYRGSRARADLVRGRLFERTSDLWQPGLGPTSGPDALEGSAANTRSYDAIVTGRAQATTLQQVLPGRTGLEQKIPFSTRLSSTRGTPRDFGVRAV
jgi:hypothetical protein